MFTKIISAKGFWQDVVKLAFLFMLIYNTVDIWLNYSFDFALFAENKFQSDTILRFFCSQYFKRICLWFCDKLF